MTTAYKPVANPKRPQSARNWFEGTGIFAVADGCPDLRIESCFACPLHCCRFDSPQAMREALDMANGKTELIRQAKERYSQGEAIDRIARDMGISPRRLNRWLQRRLL